MRILANYGYKNNGDSYSVTFETMGDCPKDQADAVVDELFSMAKRAVERQINGTTTESTPHKEDVVIPEPKKNGNGMNGNGKHNGNGNGKPQPKNPGAPISAKQKQLIIKLAKERGQFIENLNEMNMAEASGVIEELMAVEA
jgi:hypothetical protein